jgi:two-component system chemotaxis sensor kinase CheA
MHSIKGTCGFIGLTRLEALAHFAEDILIGIRDGTPESADSGVRLFREALDRIGRILAALCETGFEPPGDDADLFRALDVRPADGASHVPSAAVASLSPKKPKGAGCIRKSTGSSRSTGPSRSIDAVLVEFPPLVRGLAARLGKQIECQVQCPKVDLGDRIIDPLRDALIHILRNAVDHGIECADDRIASGKPPAGLVRVNAWRDGATFNVEVADDGCGLSLERIRRKAVQDRPVEAARLARMSDRQVAELIFESGLSTVDRASWISGRGVGLYIVRTNIERLGGTVELAWTQGQGSVFTVRVPLPREDFAPAAVAASARVLKPVHQQRPR